MFKSTIQFPKFLVTNDSAMRRCYLNAKKEVVMWK